MDGILEWGYDLINWTQQFSPALDTLFKAISTLGAEQVYLLLLPLIYWCVHKRRGVQLALLLMFSSYVNLAFKDLLDQPRPAPERVKVLAEETSPGLPSFHSQNSIAVYGFLALQIRQRRAWVAAALIAFAVGASRIYLGVHFPSDVLGGWLIGAAILALFWGVVPEAEYRLRMVPWNYKLALAAILPLALFFVYASENGAQLSGVVLGFSTGVLVELRWVGFSPEGLLWQRVLRFLIGGVILVAVWLGFKAIFPSEPETVGLVFRLIRYTLVGAWTSLGAPWFFVRIGLAPHESEVRSKIQTRF